MPLIETHGLTKGYPEPSGTVEVLRGIDMTVEAGEFAVVMGPSGSGKTTLLNLLAGIDTPDSGSILIEGTDISGMSDRQLTGYRKNKIGYVFQFYNLIPSFTALENVELALQIGGVKDLSPAADMLGSVGLGTKRKRFPGKLSGGEQQRVAIARALVRSPLLLVADEPTGNLDAATSREIVDLLVRFNREQNMTMVVATHDSSYRELATSLFQLREGKLV